MILLAAIAVVILIPLVQGMRSDHRGYCAAVEKWKILYKLDPITAGPKPQFDWDLFRGRMIDSGYAIVLLLVTFFTSMQSQQHIDTAALEVLIREFNAAATQPTGGAQ